MKKYIQLTAGRGPVECARAVTLVARELLKDFPDADVTGNQEYIKIGNEATSKIATIVHQKR